jgi:hypothetical protein
MHRTLVVWLTAVAALAPAPSAVEGQVPAAELVGQDAKTGSLKVGKAADLALIDGDPSTRIGDLRQTRVVMLDGRLLGRAAPCGGVLGPAEVTRFV